MKYCQNCGAQIADEAVICVHCGVATAPQNIQKPVEDKVNVWFCILAFFIPLFGFIYWGVNYNAVPKKAKATGITAIISTILSVLAYIIIYVLFIVVIMAGTTSGYSF